jgi:hypothetical protein
VTGTREKSGGDRAHVAGTGNEDSRHQAVTSATANPS